MNHPKLTKALAALDDARTEVGDVLEAGGDHVDELRLTLNLINRAILNIPHIPAVVPNA